MTTRRWDDERWLTDAPVYMSAEEAHVWAAGWNAAVNECAAQLGTAVADLHALVEVCRNGEFYKDYDESTALLGRAQDALDVVARTRVN